MSMRNHHFLELVTGLSNPQLILIKLFFANNHFFFHIFFKVQRKQFVTSIIYPKLPVYEKRLVLYDLQLQPFPHPPSPSLCLSPIGPEEWRVCHQLCFCEEKGFHSFLKRNLKSKKVSTFYILEK